MNKEILNALVIYLETLIELNRQVLSLYGFKQYELENKTILDIAHNICRLVPFGRVKGKNQLRLRNNDGLMEYKNEISYLNDKYQFLLDTHYTFLDKINTIRNKSEHKMHIANVKGCLQDSGNNGEYFFACGENEDDGLFSVSATECVNFTKDINLLFAQLQSEAKLYAEKNNLTEYPCFIRYFSLSFADFNIIYDLNLMNLVGKIIQC